jgi:hypothetical protein
MAKWPEHVVYAFEQAGYHNPPYLELAIEGFASRWNGLDVETFIRVLKEGQGKRFS